MCSNSFNARSLLVILQIEERVSTTTRKSELVFLIEIRKHFPSNDLRSNLNCELAGKIGANERQLLLD